MNDNNRIRVLDVMEQDFVMVDGMTTVTEAVELMRQNSANHLIINRRTKHDEYGIVVPSDIATRVLAQNRPRIASMSTRSCQSRCCSYDPKWIFGIVRGFLAASAFRRLR